MRVLVVLSLCACADEPASRISVETPNPRPVHQADLVLTLSAPRVLAARAPLELEASVENLGPDIAYQPIIHFELPSAHFIKSTGNCQVYVEGSVDCTLRGIFKAETLDVTLTLELPLDEADAGALEIQADVHHFDEDPNPGNNQAAFSVDLRE